MKCQEASRQKFALVLIIAAFSTMLTASAFAWSTIPGETTPFMQSLLMKSMSSCNLKVLNHIENNPGINWNEEVGSVSGVGGATPILVVSNAIAQYKMTKINVKDCIAALQMALKHGASPLSSSELDFSPDAITYMLGYIGQSYSTNGFNYNATKEILRAIGIMQDGLDYNKIIIFREKYKDRPMSGDLLMLMCSVAGNGYNYETSEKNSPAANFFMSVVHHSNVNISNKNGKTALMIAAKNGYWAIVKYLLNHGANKNLMDHNGKKAYDYALQSKSEKTVEALM